MNTKFSRLTGSDKAIMIFAYAILGLFMAAIILPVIYIILASFIDPVTLKNSGLTFTPQDSPLLARDLEETEPVREILSECGEVKEMLLNREHSMLAGNLVMNEYMPDVMRKVAQDRWINAENAGAEILVTTSPAEYIILSAVKPENIKLMKLEEAVLKCL